MPKLVNTYITSKKMEFKKLHNELLLEAKTITTDVLKNRLLGIQEKDTFKTLLQLIDFHINLLKSKVGIDVATTTYIKCVITRKRIVEYLQKQYNKQDIKLNELKLDFIVGFDLFLKSVHKNSHNTVVKHCKNLKAVINSGIHTNG